MKKLKIATIIGTRPETIKLSEVIKKSNKYFEHILVHTGQNYDYVLNQVFFDDLSIQKPDYFLNVVGSDLGETIGNIINKSYKVLNEIKPDALLVLGDTNSCLSVISAKRLKIPVFHLEAGNRCFDENLPEEINRRIVDHISDVNFCYTEHARRYLLLEGVNMSRTFVVGSPMYEILNKYSEKIDNSEILNTLNLKEGQFILVSAHREENIDNENNFFELMNAINSLARHYDMPVIYSVHPRSKKIIDMRGFIFDKRVRKLEPFGFFDYNKLQKSAYCVVSDSGTIAEEASFFKFPAVSIRTSTERPEAIDKGNLVIGGINELSIIQAIDLSVSMKEDNVIGSDVPDYISQNQSANVLKIIQSYVGIINNDVWKKKR